jgi:Resolvase, N terminal domain/AAA domain
MRLATLSLEKYGMFTGRAVAFSPHAPVHVVLGAGWRIIPARYDDGAFSGASLDRPALQHLLAEVRSGKVDVVVVYKVDRLTRSLADFAKLVELASIPAGRPVSVLPRCNMGLEIERPSQRSGSDGIAKAGKTSPPGARRAFCGSDSLMTTDGSDLGAAGVSARAIAPGGFPAEVPCSIPWSSSAGVCGATNGNRAAGHPTFRLLRRDCQA